MKYIWTKKRKKAARNLVTLSIFVVLYQLVVPSLDGAFDAGMSPQHPVLRVFLVILVLYGLYSVANDIRVLLIYEPDEVEERLSR